LTQRINASLFKAASPALHVYHIPWRIIIGHARLTPDLQTCTAGSRRAQAKRQKTRSVHRSCVLAKTGMGQPLPSATGFSISNPGPNLRGYLPCRASTAPMALRAKPRHSASLSYRA